MKKISPRAAIAFFMILTLCLSLASAMIINRSKVERLVMEQLILEKSVKINDVMSKHLYKTQMLSSLVLHNNGEIIHFDQTAAIIIDDDAIVNILVAPGGVVTNVYPLAGNEAVLGLDFFADGAGNKEAVLAKETGQLVLGGPFEAVQGFEVLVGRLPVFTTAEDGSKDFWGLVSVTLRYPDALDGAGLNELKIQGFAYEIWRINPDDGQRQIIADSGHNYKPNTHYIERQINVANAEWYFRILPVPMWYSFPETWIALFLSFCISLLVAAVIKNNQDLNILKNGLEILSNTDSLTGIHNRRYFMKTAAQEMDRVIRSGSESFIIMFDLDYFKNVNDTYNHQTGDEVLREVSARVSQTLRSYDLFARYGGEEFIILVADMDKTQAFALAERIRQNVGGNPINACCMEIAITVSLGISPAAPAYELETAISQADEALYQAKREGRDRTMFHEDGGRINVS